MKRKELEKLPVLRATTAMLKQAENEPMIESGYYRKKLRYKYEYYARCKQFGQILKVAIYLTENLAAGGRKPVYELFLDYDAQDFLTYSFKEKKWRTAMLRNLSQQWDSIYDARISYRDSVVIGQYLHSKWGAIASIREFQEGIREKQLLIRYKKETDPWDAAMALVPPLPKDWDRWVSKVGVEQNYMFYQYQRGGAKTGYHKAMRELALRYTDVLDQIFIQLDGRSFQEKAFWELQQRCYSAVWNTYKNEPQYVQQKDIIHFYCYFCSCDADWVPPRWSMTDRGKSVLWGIIHFETGSYTMVPAVLSDFFSYRDVRQACTDFHGYSKLRQIRLFKNGRMDIRFASSELAEQFIDIYLNGACA